jgi:hypothetical protein
MTMRAVTPAEKNLHAFIPAELLRRAQVAAKRDEITLDDLVADAVERRVGLAEFEEMLAFGKRHAKKRGLKPGDVARAIGEVRGNKSRGR